MARRISWGNWPKWYLVPLQIIIVFDLVTVTALAWFFQQTSFFSLVALIAQISGVALIVWDINEKFTTLRGEHIGQYVRREFKSWTNRLFNIREASFSTSATVRTKMSIFAASSYAETTKRLNLDERIGKLEIKLKDLNELIEKYKRELGEAKSELRAEIKKAKHLSQNEIEKEIKSVMERVVSINAAGIARPLWSVFLISYSAVLTYLS